MDNKDLEDILESKFSELRKPISTPSMVPDVMRRISGLPEVRPVKRRFEWLLALGWILGAAVCFTGFQGFDMAALANSVNLSFAGFGQYQQVAGQISVVLLGFALCSPLLWLALEE